MKLLSNSTLLPALILLIANVAPAIAADDTITQEELVRTLAACDQYPDTKAARAPNSRRLRSLVLLMRHSGIRIGDTATCAMDRVTGMS